METLVKQILLCWSGYHETHTTHVTEVLPYQTHKFNIRGISRATQQQIT